MPKPKQVTTKDCSIKHALDDNTNVSAVSHTTDNIPNQSLKTKDLVNLYLQQGKSPKYIAEQLNVSYRDVLHHKRGNEQNFADVESYKSTRLLENINLQKDAKTLISKIFEELLSRDISQSSIKELAEMAKHSIVIQDNLYKQERLAEGKATKNVEHFWSQVMQASDEQLLRSYQDDCIDISASASIKPSSVE